ncbi:MAG: HEPN domain-containing protein [bacterium]
MTLKMEDKKILSDIRMGKAYEFLEDARVNHKEGRYKTSINRSYYAALNAIRSILILEGANPETHEGVITMFSLRFIKPALLPINIIKNFKILLSRRTDVDYGDFETIDLAESEDSLKITKEIIEAVDIMRRKLI